ncbi:hypothetical protein A3C09_02630 [Candidatus Uhrbacteria bacterium RIFCSPHIGHO2_02_FULL_47_44]|uniref:HTH merR-type domain-containing protein n=1 Tax=Candidatus Uhrbacteria bacterium RIFCSPLOWO2_02_FULL_48_18 TaxID=1802408 RepID=A0A1F7V7C9_9BACT|nr:MAG: hypothetical protein A3C09_02630 [Candidatus Uhrbacteria bacterium RIFCSPHIGHO2_02_FULL_47_44]OGL77104.1 MAG: hypothetical protein A3E97_03375 [Candidatus Uhrbacteria bacterium RIFCSPHIGHO2_12_FULL_47_12]OGL80445.1 MAG: hypothetical protein A3B20_03475 [Candidatus Uhrbacteria bacterium RIFCSPLOWO2_01_FULL_47_17]OGL86305.1 MAG: hypothetical protein A3I41_01955 [Candidatus Uhrbacteria bacterium RIFCSPLOWO2_02_FULL_48_18]OGL94051.1 MAG: hypothetical protein A3H12_00705 [Candidatus Uhrbacte
MISFSKNYLTISEAARYLGVSQMTLRRWHNDGTFSASYVTPGGHRYYSLADLNKKTKGILRLAQEWVHAETPFVPESDFYCQTSDVFKTRFERMVHEMDANPLFIKTASLISSAAGEIGSNSYDHNIGNWPDVPGIFFAYDLGKRIIILADRGQGVLKTLQRVRPNLVSDQEALHVAFTEILTSRENEHRGNGLKYTKDALNLADATLNFQSGTATLRIQKGILKFKTEKTPDPIHGCLSVIEF